MRTAPLFLLLAAAGVLSSCVTLPDWARWGGRAPAPPAAEPAPQGPVELIHRISRAELQTMESYPLQYRLRASGMAPSAGWSLPELRARPLLRPPADGIYDYEFVARPPQGMAAQVLTPIEAATPITLPRGAQGVRVHSRTNAEVVPLR